MWNPWSENTFSVEGDTDCRLLLCGRREKSVSHAFGPYDRDTYLFTYVTEGAAEMDVGGRRIPVSAGDFYVFFPHCGFSYITQPDLPWSILWFSADGAQIRSFLSAAGITPEDPLFRIRQQVHLAAQLDALFLHSGSAAAEDRFLCLSILYEIFSLLIQERKHSVLDLGVLQAVRIMETRFASGVTVGEIADELHLNRNYFTKRFRHEMGVSPINLLQTIRFDHAVRLLRFSELSVSEISAACGFQDALYFSRSFHRKFGQPPSAYRQAFRVPASDPSLLDSKRRGK